MLPFDDLGDDAQQDYFAEGLTDDLITDLSKISGLLVIARNSAFAFKDQPKDVGEIARQLGVRYVLGGSVRRAGDGSPHQRAADRRRDREQRLGGAL